MHVAELLAARVRHPSATSIIEPTETDVQQDCLKLDTSDHSSYSVNDSRCSGARTQIEWSGPSDNNTQYIQSSTMNQKETERKEDMKGREVGRGERRDRRAPSKRPAYNMYLLQEPPHATIIKRMGNKSTRVDGVGCTSRLTKQYALQFKLLSTRRAASAVSDYYKKRQAGGCM